VLIVCLASVALAPVAAGAQATTADGVQAILRGDYQAAVRILRPLSETVEAPDPLAQFFMAMLYESGHGVPRDIMRACGLYLNAAKPGNPLAGQAVDLARVIQGPSGGRFAEFCDAASASHSSPAPPRSFTLAPDHVVTIDEYGATVRYRGSEKRTGMGGFAGLVALPLRYTPVAISRPVEGRRHFIQYFLWMPHLTADPPTWTLGWILQEVVGLEFLPVAGDPAVATVTALRPPAAFDVESVVRVGVNANGEAEWIVSGGENPRRGVVPFKELP
jgi:hypothetical protein